MVKEVRHYGTKLCCDTDKKTTTRYIFIEEASRGGFLVSIYELRPTRIEYGHTAGLEGNRVSIDWFLTIEEAIVVGEIALRSAFNLGFYEIDAELTAEL
jgi:hypothetical protein